jgi:hypothetical protein
VWTRTAPADRSSGAGIRTIGTLAGTHDFQAGPDSARFSGYRQNKRDRRSEWARKGGYSHRLGAIEGQSASLCARRPVPPRRCSFGRWRHRRSTYAARGHRAATWGRASDPRRRHRPEREEAAVTEGAAPHGGLSGREFRATSQPSVTNCWHRMGSEQACRSREYRRAAGPRAPRRAQSRTGPSSAIR